MEEYGLFFENGLPVERVVTGFQTPKEYCFHPEDTQLQCNDCERKKFIRCAWCRQLFCFYHYYDMYHICEFSGNPDFMA